MENKEINILANVLQESVMDATKCMSKLRWSFLELREGGDTKTADQIETAYDSIDSAKELILLIKKGIIL